jgi:hypothetical protein
LLQDQEIKCFLCRKKIPEENAEYNLRRDSLEVYCGNPECFDPNQKIIFKDYDNHLNFCYTKGKCPNGCLVKLENVDEAKAHFSECIKCKFCHQDIYLKSINEHDCLKNILEIKNKNEELTFT